MEARSRVGLPVGCTGEFAGVRGRYGCLYKKVSVLRHPSLVALIWKFMDMFLRRPYVLLQVVCDFGGLAGRTLYLWNARDDYRMKDVPFFCHSHLVMKFVVRGCSSSSSGAKRHLLQDTTTTTTDGTSTGITQGGSGGTDPSGAGAGTDPAAGGGVGGGSTTGGAEGGGSTAGGDAGTGGDGAAANRGQAIDPASFGVRCSPPGTDFDASTPSRPALDDVSSVWRAADHLHLMQSCCCLFFLCHCDCGARLLTQPCHAIRLEALH